MKKTILLLCVVFSCSACFPTQYRYNGEWFVKNCTDYPLALIYPELNDDIDGFNTLHIAPGDSTLISGFGFNTDTKPRFDKWLEFAAGSVHQILNVLSEDGDLLREWRYDEREMPGKQFYDESYWKCYPDIPGYTDDSVIKTVVISKTAWVFEIMPEDIVDAEQQ